MNELIKKLRSLEKLVHKTPHIIATQAVVFTKNRFRDQNWVDTQVQPWAKRKEITWGRKTRPGRAILTDTARLKRSIKIISITSDTVIIGTDVAYAKAHNEGFDGTIQQTVKAHKRAKTVFGIIKTVSQKKSTRITYGRGKIGEIKVRQYTRKINVNIPKRQFMGNSKRLNKQINGIIINEFKQIFK